MVDLFIFNHASCHPGARNYQTDRWNEAPVCVFFLLVSHLFTSLSKTSHCSSNLTRIQTFLLFYCFFDEHHSVSTSSTLLYLQVHSWTVYTVCVCACVCYSLWQKAKCQRVAKSFFCGPLVALRGTNLTLCSTW